MVQRISMKKRCELVCFWPHILTFFDKGRGKEGRKEGRKEASKDREGRKEGWKEASKDREGRKEGRKQPFLFF